MSSPIRVRFAPSPTGPLHIGGVRTALYNYLLAKKHNGQFILRIEDTDLSRLVPGAEEYILDTLQWLGIEPDEGPAQGGPYGPYRQFARQKSYRSYVEKLLATGHAYHAFDTPEELDAMRQRLRAAKVPNPQYNAISRVHMRNALTLPQEEVKDMLTRGVPHVIRIKMPHREDVRFKDTVRGWVKMQTAELDDKVLMKSDGMPTYHFANVVDDYTMRISHVIRGEEWIPSTPIHVLLYRYLGWEASIPQFVHLPLLLKPEGTGKLSKRDAEQHGFPIFPLRWVDPSTQTTIEGFRERGFLPDALLNFLALLGWNPGGKQEIMDRKTLLQKFSLERIGRSGVRFNIHKAEWFNQQYLRTQPIDTLVGYLARGMKDAAVSAKPEKIKEVCRLMQERAIFPKDFWEQGKYFFVAPETYQEDILKKQGAPQVYPTLRKFAQTLRSLQDFRASTIRELLGRMAQENGLKLGQILPLVRVAITGGGPGPDLMQSMEVIGQKESVDRIDRMLTNNT